MEEGLMTTVLFCSLLCFGDKALFHFLSYSKTSPKSSNLSSSATFSKLDTQFAKKNLSGEWIYFDRIKYPQDMAEKKMRHLPRRRCCC